LNRSFNYPQITQIYADFLINHPGGMGAAQFHRIKILLGKQIHMAAHRIVLNRLTGSEFADAN